MNLNKHFLTCSIMCSVGIAGFSDIAHANATPAVDNQQPNIIFIISDDEDRDHIGAYGGAVETPNLDSIANNGIQFMNANAVTTVCSPSRYGLFTGRYYDSTYDPGYLSHYPAGTAATLGNESTLESDNMNIATWLRDAGYSTGFVGKLHLIHHEQLTTTREWESAGLQEYTYDSDPKTDPEVNRKMQENHQWWAHEIENLGFDYANGIYSANSREIYNQSASKIHNVEYTADAALKFINQQKSSKKPFFLYMATTYSHGPDPSVNKKGEFYTSLDANPAYTPEGYIEKDYSKVIEERMALKNNKALAKKGKYARTAKWWDNQVGRVIDTLKANSQYENTIIVYAADHNKTNNQKSTLYKGGIEVPMMAQWPAKLKSGVKYEGVTGIFDMVPTVLEAANVKLPKQAKPMDAVSFYPLFEGDTKDIRDYLVVKIGYQMGVVTRDWKYLALRYSEEIEQGIQERRTFAGHRDEQMPQPFYMTHVQLSKKAALKNKNYFQRNQLYRAGDKTDQTNLYAEFPEKAAEMKLLLKEGLASASRPFGEFKGDNPEAFSHVEDVIYFPKPFSLAPLDMSNKK